MVIGFAGKKTQGEEITPPLPLPRGRGNLRCLGQPKVCGKDWGGSLELVLVNIYRHGLRIVSIFMGKGGARALCLTYMICDLGYVSIVSLHGILMYCRYSI